MSFVSTPQELQYQRDHPHQSRTKEVIASTVILLVVAYVAVVLRFIARLKSRVRFGADDVTILIALLFLTAFGVVLFVCLDFGFGRHLIYTSNPRGIVISYVLDIAFYCTATVFTKASILFLYCRIFRSQNLFRLSVALIVFVLAYSVAGLLVTVLECIPLSNIWQGIDSRCINTKPALTAIGIVNVVTGFAILIIPVRFVLRLNMDNFRKFQVCCVFLTGIITCAFGIVRVVVFAEAGKGDLSYDLVWPAIWAFCETSIGILAACLPTMGIFFGKNRRTSQGPPNSTQRHSSTRSAFSTYCYTAAGSISKRISRHPRSPIRSLFTADHEKLASRDPVTEIPPTPTTNLDSSGEITRKLIGEGGPDSLPSPITNINSSGDTTATNTYYNINPNDIIVTGGPSNAITAPAPVITGNNNNNPQIIPGTGGAQRREWVLDVRIPDHSLQRSSANTDSLTKWIIHSARNSARSSMSWLSQWSNELG